jgi:hypothetical protein
MDDNGLKETDGAAAAFIGSAAAKKVIIGTGSAAAADKTTVIGPRRGFTQYTADELELISQDVITCQAAAEGNKPVYQKDLVSGLSVVALKSFSLDPSGVLQRRGGIMIAKGAAMLDYCEATLLNLSFLTDDRHGSDFCSQGQGLWNRQYYSAPNSS